ncbi:tetratricopeptide repeat protein [Azospirillum rugosum]|uniref:TPR repeat protein n=1 Tax=Azospirillum rugosum TaxID=416170 RepID=A0ABS4SUU4_9PROT|nr:tetratricopeptide repeat protein [Azospirillum rugosum]MBP2296330.1 TPR repeat protein [Azospirillum rugosum]MDQ0529851.1 TPR repeat protein [Azospirillum rugosum]
MATETTGAAAAPGIIDVQLALGQICLDRGSAAQAAEWFRIAARSGDARAINMMGRCFERGWGVPADPGQAAACYRKAADRGDAWALFNLADLHCRGEGVPADDAAAYRLYAAAARKGHAKALNMLGLFHECGRAVPVDGAAARAFFQAAAEGGDCWGRFNHARMLILDGRLEEALPWFRRALDAGFPDFYRCMADALAGHPDPRLRALARQAAAMAEAGTPS